MALRIIHPFGEAGDTKDLIVTILASEYPLKIIELSNYMKKRYGKSVSFQAVRKAAMQLASEGVLKKEGSGFSISKEWVAANKSFIDSLYMKLSRENGKPARSESVGSEVQVFVLDSMMEMMRAWENLTWEWGRNFRKGDYNYNCYQAPHSWEVLTHSEEEARMMSQFHEKGVISYILCTSNTPLDRSIVKFHDKIGVKMAIKPSSSTFDKSYYVGTYGDLVLQARCPPDISKRIDDFFRKNKSMEELDLAELFSIVNAKTKVKMTAIRSIEMAKHVNQSIISQIER